jgi:hypothetical protein
MQSSTANLQQVSIVINNAAQSSSKQGAA